MMKLSISLVIVLSLIAIGCGTTVRQLNANCTQSTEDLFKSISALAMSKNFSPKMSDSKLGILILETEPNKSVWTGVTEKRVWQFHYDNGKLTASGKEVSFTTNAFGAVLSTNETYYDDKASKDLDWFWDVRNGIQKICGDIVFTEKVTK